MKINNLQEAQIAVANYHGDYKAALSSERADKKASNTALEASTHERNYVLLAEAYGIASALLGVPDILAQLLNTYGVPAARAGQNEFGPIVSALFRTAKKSGSGTVPNKSAWKFGNILRFIRDSGWKQEAIPEKLAACTFKHPDKDKVYTKLLAAELADRHRYQEVDEEKIEADKALRWFLGSKEIGVVTSATFHPTNTAGEDGELVSLAASWDKDRKEWVIRAIVSTNNDSVLKSLSLLRKDAVKAFEEHTKDLFKRLAVHNTVIESLEQELQPADQELVKAARNDPRYLEVSLPPKQSRSRSNSMVEA